jgi:hypothetical protein
MEEPVARFVATKAEIENMNFMVPKIGSYSKIANDKWVERFLAFLSLKIV